MFKKYKIKKRRKFISPYYIFILFIISVLFVSVGYSYLSDTIKITGKANILNSGGSGDIEYGNSTYTWAPAYSWGGGGSLYTYAMVITITNLDEDYRSDKSIEISFDVPDGCVLDSSININVWQAESATLDGNTITLKFSTNGSWLPIGETLTIYPHLYFENETNVTITNLKFAGKYATLVE